MFWNKKEKKEIEILELVNHKNIDIKIEHSLKKIIVPFVKTLKEMQSKQREILDDFFKKAAQSYLDIQGVDNNKKKETINKTVKELLECFEELIAYSAFLNTIPMAFLDKEGYFEQIKEEEKSTKEFLNKAIPKMEHLYTTLINFKEKKDIK